MIGLRQVSVTQTASQSLRPAPMVSSQRADRKHGPDTIVPLSGLFYALRLAVFCSWT